MADVTRGIVLSDEQKAHVDRMEVILQRNLGVIDCSSTGSGKTITALAVARRFGMNVFVVSPCTTKDIWVKKTKEYGVPLVGVWSYESFRSVKGSQPSHGYLSRTESPSGPSFDPTQKFFELLATHSVLFVFDEAQKLRNTNESFKACRSLIHAARLRGGCSRIALLSASLFDKEEQAVHIMNLLGIVNDSKMCVKGRSRREPDFSTLTTLIEFTHSIDPVETERVMEAFTITQKNADRVAYILFLNVIKPAMVSAMDPPKHVASIDAANYSAEMGEDGEKLQIAISSLRKIFHSNEDGSLSVKSGGFGTTTTAMMSIESAKARTLCRKVRESLSTPGVKAVVFVNYNATFDYLTSELSDFGPLSLNGKVPEKKRYEVVQLFQAHNNDHRLIISNIVVGGVSIDLHDTHGSFPRHVWMIPTHNLIDMLQAAGRVHRRGVMSVPVIRVLYGKTPVREESILKTLWVKSGVSRDIIAHTSADDRTMMLPGEYPQIDE